MSRLARKPLLIPDGVKVNLEEGKIVVEGKLGKLEGNFVNNFVDVKSDGKQMIISSKGPENLSKMYQGLYFRIFQNMIVGVTEGYSKTLAIQGLGYKWEIKGKELVLMVGYSKPVKYPIPEGINMKIDSANLLVISGCDKQKVGQAAAEIRSIRSPEPYKGKGIRYLNERIKLKEGKAAK
jgi:large subunit ribosomal protein L6